MRRRVAVAARLPMKKIKALLATFSLLFGVVSDIEAQSWVTNGLAAYFPFNGNPNDASGNGLNAQIYNPSHVTLVADRFGTPSSAYSFGSFLAGEEPHIWGTGMLLANSSLTISFWIKGHYTQPLDDYGGIGVGMFPPGVPNPGGSTGNNLHIYVSSNPGIRFSFFYDDCDTTQKPPSNQWAQVCVVFNNTNMSRSTYINGVEVANRTAAYGFSGNDIFSINGRNGVSMDDVRFYRRALSSGEVTQLHAIESAPRINLIRAVKPAFSGLAIGTNYQLQTSGNLINWTNQGSAFSATTNNMTYPQYWDVDGWGSLFFRLQVAP